jgi:glycosyltransferase involved in cell wall biosynthesis
MTDAYERLMETTGVGGFDPMHVEGSPNRAPLRVLAWPIYSYAGNPLADSGYICFRNLIRAIPEWTWHLVVPDWAKGDKELHDDLDGLHNVVKVPVPMLTLYRAQEAALDPVTLWKYSPQMGEQPIDAVVAGSNQIALHLANAWSIRSQEDDRPYVIAWDLLTRDDRNKGWRSEDVELLAHFAGAAVADLNVYGSEMMRWMTADMLRKLLSPAVMRQVLQQRSETIYAGVPVKRIDEVTAGIPKRDKFTVFYGGRFGAVKRVDDLTEIADLAFMFGRDMGMVACTGSITPNKAETFRQQFPMVELHVGTSQEEAWRLMAQCHAGIMWSKHEMIGSMFVEEMVAGLPLIAHEHRWLKALLPDDYPLWARDTTTAGAHLRNLYDVWKADPTRSDPIGETWSRYVRERYDSEDASQRFRRTVEQRVLPLRQKAFTDFGNGHRKAMLELAEQVLVEGMTFAEYLKAVRKAATIGRTFVGRKLETARSNSILDAYRAALYLGWRDVNPTVPTFVR